MSSRIRLLCVSHMGSRGGAQKALRLLCTSLDPNRFEVEVAVPSEGGLACDLRNAGVPVHAAPVRWWVSVGGREANAARSFRRGLQSRVDRFSSLIEDRAPDIVVSNSAVVAEGALAAALCGVPHVWHVLEMMGRDPGIRPLYPLESFYWMISRLSTRIVAVSESVRAELVERCAGLRAEVIHTGIDHLERDRLRKSKEELFGVEEADRVICFVGDLTRRKGARVLVRAFPSIAREHPSALLAIVGADQGELAALKRIARSLGVAKRVRFFGARKDALEIIASADLLVLPSWSDPFPIVLLEAMALGVPVVATRSGGAEEMLVHGESGLLVDPGSASELAAAVAEFLHDRGLLESIGLGARERARERYSLPAFGSSFGSLIAEAVGRGTEDERLEARAVANLVLSGCGAAQGAWLRRAGENARAILGPLLRRLEPLDDTP